MWRTTQSFNAVFVLQPRHPKCMQLANRSWSRIRYCSFLSWAEAISLSAFFVRTFSSILWAYSCPVCKTGDKSLWKVEITQNLCCSPAMQVSLPRPQWLLYSQQTIFASPRSGLPVCLHPQLVSQSFVMRGWSQTRRLRWRRYSQLRKGLRVIMTLVLVSKEICCTPRLVPSKNMAASSHLCSFAINARSPMPTRPCIVA